MTAVLIALFTSWAFWIFLFLLACLYTFKSQLRGFFSRATKIGAYGFTVQSPVEQPTENVNTIINETIAKDTPTIPKTTPSLRVSDLPISDALQPYVEKLRQKPNISLTQDDHIELLIRVLAAWQLFADYQRAARFIFGSQLYFLANITSTAGESNISMAMQFYENAKRQFPDQYRERDFETWLSFMTANNLISRSGTSIKITPHGKDFLKHLIDTNDTGNRVA